jgi:hypothetical protein
MCLKKIDRTQKELASGKVQKVPKDIKKKFLPLVELAKRCTNTEIKKRPNSGQLVILIQK